MLRETLKTRSGRVLELPTEEEDAQIRAAVLSDPDAHPYTQEEWEAAAPRMCLGRPRIGRPPFEEPKKAPITIRLDVEVIAGLKSTGKGWQTRVNAVLSDWLKTHSPGEVA